MSIELACVPGVELARTGQWSASTGESTITRDDLANAVEAMGCPAVRDPVIKLGHTDPRFDGQPAVGRITNLEVVDGYSLRGDLDGLPEWLGQILASAFPSRSIEATWNYQCSVGHTHDFVLTGLALLGVQAPAIASLDDIAALYGVTDTPPVDLAAGKGKPVAPTIAASATVEDIRRLYYDTAGWELWIEEIQLDPLQLIVVNDIDGTRSRIPVTVDPALDGTDALTFGEPVPVIVRYDDVTGQPPTDPAAPVEVAASNLRFASRTESQRVSRAGHSEGETMARTIAAAADTGSGDANPGGLSDDQLATLRELVGLTENADPAILGAALEALVAKFKPEDAAPEEEAPADDEAPADEAPADGEDDEKKKVAVAASASGPGTVTVDAEQWAAVQQFMASAQKREQAARSKAADDMVDAAFAAGKIGKSSVAAYKEMAHNDFDGTKKVLGTLAASSAFPTGEIGHSVPTADTTNVRDDAAYKNWSI